jgi:hypothetical protein
VQGLVGDRRDLGAASGARTRRGWGRWDLRVAWGAGTHRGRGRRDLEVADGCTVYGREEMVTDF